MLKKIKEGKEKKKHRKSSLFKYHSLKHQLIKIEENSQKSLGLSSIILTSFPNIETYKKRQGEIALNYKKLINYLEVIINIIPLTTFNIIGVITISYSQPKGAYNVI